MATPVSYTHLDVYKRQTLDLAALETLPDARLLEALMQQHGVGIKGANCVALFAYYTHVLNTVLL